MGGFVSWSITPLHCRPHQRPPTRPPSAQSAKDPHVSITGTEDHAFYTLICTDPDAPDPANPTKAEFVHWIVTNIQKGDIKSGDKVLSYV